MDMRYSDYKLRTAEVKSPGVERMAERAAGVAYYWKCRRVYASVRYCRGVTPETLWNTTEKWL